MVIFRISERWVARTLLATVLFSFSGLAAAEETDGPPQDADHSGPSLTELSIQDLMNVQVTSVSKKEEKRTDAAAAIFVITQDDIRRAGVTKMADALRMVPGIDVAQISSNSWAVTSRGFNGAYANKLLVIVDGRCVYGPLFAGVFWQIEDMVLEDIDRIEVIRGPGGTQWGANAVNGVINIITKKARDTQGGLVSAGVGTLENDFVSSRYGGKLGQDTFFRVSGKYFDRDAGTLASGKESSDDWNMGEGSFRVDSQPDKDNSLTLGGSLFGADTSSVSPLQYLLPPYVRNIPYHQSFSGGHLMGRWSHQFAEDSTMQLQTYYDRVQSLATDVNETWDTYDVDFQHQFKVGERNNIVWGLGFRHIEDSVDNTRFISLDPRHNQLNLYSGFLTDEITLVEDRLRLSVGSKFEHNDFTGFEVQPGASLSWTPNEKNTVWAAVSRAVRTPSLIERYGNIRAFTGPFLEGAMIGNENYDSEELTAFELGYRIQATPKLAFDATAYYNLYRNLRSIELNLRGVGMRMLPPRLYIPFQGQNNADAGTYGFELAVDAEPAPWWRMRAALSVFEIGLDINAKTFDPISSVEAGNTPEKQLYMLNSFDLSRSVALNWTLRYCDRLDALDVPGYFTMDAGLDWRVSKSLQFSLVGQNLVQSSHFEFAPEYLNTVPTQVDRSGYAKLTWTF